MQDIVNNGFEFKSGEAAKCKIDPNLLCDRLWIISNLMFDTVLQYRLMMGKGEDGAVQIYLKGANTAQKAIAEEEEWKQKHERRLGARFGK